MVTQLVTSLVISRDGSTLLNKDRDKPDMGDDIAGDRPGMAGDTPIKGCGPTLGNKVGSYEGNDAILPLLYLYTLLSVYLQWYVHANNSHAPTTIGNLPMPMLLEHAQSCI